MWVFKMMVYWLVYNGELFVVWVGWLFWVYVKVVYDMLEILYFDVGQLLVVCGWSLFD